MNKILLIEDSPMFSRALSSGITQELTTKVDCAYTLSEASALLAANHEYFVILADLTLPDATESDILDEVLQWHIPVIAMATGFSEEKRDDLLDRGVLDYVIKGTKTSFHYVINLLHRLFLNRFISVLVVEDTFNSMPFVTRQLRHWQLIVHEAATGADALAILGKHPEIKLVLTDYHTQGMNGTDLIKSLREKRSKEDLAIIGISAINEKSLAARFIKYGANDFLTKPFAPEELLCRVNQNLEQLELLTKLREMTYRDYLTQLFNRRYLFEKVEKQFHAAKSAGQQVTLCVMDIDHFKRINDAYGSHSGDTILRTIAALFAKHFPDFITFRLGGEEFGLIAFNTSFELTLNRIEQFRTSLKNTPMDLGHPVYVTASFGITDELTDKLDDMVQAADRLLYLAKQQGRDQVCSNTDTD
ncbi:diguanylate cyclase [Tolumonas osonensis]|uniref:diguanylate cyclase n=1 Tax=Tolumonas osonensis TaxID=675874 RepID=A0A841GB68_9GAMM|nr:diguanylate cyclase [Tolumonas osonensis]MBB6054867.1 diguanylate cyclase (GGDEF)-like protein [Tolumonas osonensis]